LTEPCCQAVADDLEKYGRWMGGSHYHCPSCNAVTGAYGHSSAWCKVTGDRSHFHRCCPGNCELDNPDEIQEEIDMWRGLEVENDKDYSFVIEESEKKLKIALDRQRKVK
jgi:hypothetical protein